jgi:putative SbcD/Mre11-related phosphoesterase
MMKFVKNYPAVFLEELKVLVIADLHIGFEYALFKSGVKIPRQTEKMKKTIKDIIKKTKSKRLVVLGDIKHEVPGTSFQERREVPSFFADLLGMVKVDIAPGNHDSNITELLPEEVSVHGTEGFRIGDYYFSHGHTWPSEKLMESKMLMIGHLHPTVEFKDSFGYSILKPIFLKGSLDKEKLKNRYGRDKEIEILALPVFNDLFTGTPIKAKFENNLLGPVFRNKFIDLDNSEAYLIDGTFVGKIKDI